MRKVIKEKKFFTLKTVLWLFISAVLVLVTGYFVFIGFEFKR